MRICLLILSLGSFFSVLAQEDRKRIGFDLELSGSYVGSEAVVDNWIGDKPTFAQKFTGTINLNFGNGKGAIGLGGGALLWGDRSFYPLHVQLVAPFSLLLDSSKIGAFWQRVSFDGRFGTIIGRAESAHGSLRSSEFYQAGLRYRIGPAFRGLFHVGFVTEMFTFRGPYMILNEGEWHERNAGFISMGPALWLTY